VEGAYGFQISGRSTISGTDTPVSGVGRLVFDTGDRTISGYSSVNFNGFFLGNPVTGKFELKTDCSITWSLQDDSGAYQNFKGTVRPGGSRIDYAQTDPGAGSIGRLRKLAPVCNDAAFQGSYRLSATSSTTPFAGTPLSTDSVNTTAESDGNGGLTIKRGAEKLSGSYSVDSDCFVQIEIVGRKLRGILVDNGDQVLAMETDPQHVSSGVFAK